MFPLEEFFFRVPAHYVVSSYFCTMENDIRQWIDNPNRDYHEGVELLKGLGVTPRVVRMFEARSPRFAMDELVYLVRKRSTYAHLSDARPINNNESSSNIPALRASSEDPGTDSSLETNKESGFDSTPAGIAKRMVQDLHTAISKLQNNLFDVGTSNDKRSCSLRLDIMKERDQLIARYNKLFEAKEMFFAGELDGQQLMNIINYKDEMKPLDATPSIELSDVDLLKKIKAIKACITRYNNLLLYQNKVSVSHGKKLQDNPMPQCPKREKYEARIATCLQELIGYQVEAQRRGLYGIA